MTTVREERIGGTVVRIHGPATDERTPLLVLHGGPGMPHDYLLDLAALDRTVIFYDQRGCGRSDPLDDPALWTMRTFVDELTAVRAGLGLDRVHLLGHSWGGWLALEHALRRPPGLAGLILASTSASVPATEAAARALKDALPDGAGRTIDRHEAAGTTDHPDYQAAFRLYSRRHMCRTDPRPEHVRRSVEGMAHEGYARMYGSEWHVTGNLRGWDVTDRLGELDLPVLVTSGRHDVMTPEVVRPLVAGIRGARWEVFEESAHTPSAEEPERYRAVVADFLDAADRRSVG